MKTHTAVGLFQGDGDWSIKVRVGGFSSENLAKKYANGFRVRLKDDCLSRQFEDGQWIEVTDGDVVLYRLSESARSRIDRVHRESHLAGVNNADIAHQSIKEFSETGASPLVTTDADYDVVDVPVAKWERELGLTSSFGLIGYEVE